MLWKIVGLLILFGVWGFLVYIEQKFYDFDHSMERFRGYGRKK